MKKGKVLIIDENDLINKNIGFGTCNLKQEAHKETRLADITIFDGRVVMSRWWSVYR